MSAVGLHQTAHPDRAAKQVYDSLIGIDREKQELLDVLAVMLASDQAQRWRERHHPKGLPLLDRLANRPPLVILAGDVGCGKTALATSIGSPLAERLERKIVTLETPSDIRGNGMVGELSARVTAAFNAAKTAVGESRCGLLVIDEADDLATSRNQLQAHHEDRAGVNVLIKQIDLLGRHGASLAVLLITNRPAALDPAVVRRGRVIRFGRPSAEARSELFRHLLEGAAVTDRDLAALVRATERAVPFTFSDIVTKIAEAGLRCAMREGERLTASHFLAVAAEAEPTPAVDDRGV
jgi:SpoVK/Ycf46/Vps4 family AAA+-type ATPase